MVYFELGYVVPMHEFLTCTAAYCGLQFMYRYLELRARCEAAYLLIKWEWHLRNIISHEGLSVIIKGDAIIEIEEIFAETPVY